MILIKMDLRSSVADPDPGSGIWDPGSGAFLTPGSGIRDPGSRVQTHIFDNFLGKKFYNSLKIYPIFFQTSRNKIIYDFVKFVAIKKGLTRNFFSPLSLVTVLDPGSGIRDPGWVKIRIRDKHPGSATLLRS